VRRSEDRAEARGGLGSRVKRGRCNGERESEVRQMEVAGNDSTLHCTHGDDEGRVAARRRWR